MGLDMYLKKSKRVEGLTAEHYDAANDVLPWGTDAHTPFAEALPEIKNIDQLEESVKIVGEYTKYKSIFEEIGYWRKQNAIHNWFVEKCQDGIDECQLTEVTKKQLETLLEECYKVINKKDSPEELLPTSSGFFFGGTDYDDWYFMGIRDTIGFLERAINLTDWENEIIFYRSSW